MSMGVVDYLGVPAARLPPSQKKDRVFFVCQSNKGGNRRRCSPLFTDKPNLQSKLYKRTHTHTLAATGQRAVSDQLTSAPPLHSAHGSRRNSVPRDAAPHTSALIQDKQDKRVAGILRSWAGSGYSVKSEPSGERRVASGERRARAGASREPREPLASHGHSTVGASGPPQQHDA
ncbi:hypothetical protein RR46_04059 [Papilio xuthus]|uniref:Uncharacterized protein n=1 Tax=Papilio xuthus TaxID=66420 RepID=A0A194QHC0_PAPXU|nr:hypothetical protein RR46_04059 [Papilio xuthus]